MTIGTSAPPTGRTNSTPTTMETSASRPSTKPPEWPVAVTTTAPTARPTAASSETPKTYWPPGKVTGRVVISSCSFAYVITEPENETVPTSTVNAPAAAAIATAGPLPCAPSV